MWSPNAEDAYYKLQALMDTIRLLDPQVRHAPWARDLWTIISSSVRRLAENVAAGAGPL